MEPEKIGNFIAELRREQKMTQSELARLLYTDRSIVSKWERGIYIPKHDIILRLSNLFDVSVNEIYYGERQNEENKKQVNEVTINIIKDNNRKIKRLVLGSLTFIVILIMSFFIYYFINTYNSISVYKITGESSNFALHDGIMVISKEKSYIQLGNIENFKNVKINNIRLYYKNNNRDFTIFSNNGVPKLLINNFSHSELFTYDDLKYIQNNLYLEITFDNDKKDILNLTVKKDFTNNHLFRNKHNSMSNESNDISNINVPTYIQENFKLKEDEEKYYLEEIKGNKVIKHTYFYNAKLYIVEEPNSNGNIYFEYLYPNDISYHTGSNEVSTYVISENKCTSTYCDQSLIDYFMDEYINKINFEK